MEHATPKETPKGFRKVASTQVLRKLSVKPENQGVVSEIIL